MAERKQGVVLSDTPRLAYFQLHNRLAGAAGLLPAAGSLGHSGKLPCQPSGLYRPYRGGAGGKRNRGGVRFHPRPLPRGDNTVLHAGVKLGGPGYEFKYLPGGGVLDVAHCGGVTIGADVVLFENVTVHRAVYPWDETVIGDECRVNAQSHIDHGVKLGRRVKVCAAASSPAVSRRGTA